MLAIGALQRVIHLVCDPMHNISFHYYIIVRHIYVKYTLRYIATPEITKQASVQFLPVMLGYALIACLASWHTGAQ